MFTIEQISEAHSRVRSGADFPKYVYDIEALGVTRYEAYVSDGSVRYYGTEGFEVLAMAKYPVLEIAHTTNEEQFRLDLQAHQQGSTDYQTFIRDCANSGIAKWVVSIEERTCAYYGILGECVLVEAIPR